MSSVTQTPDAIGSTATLPKRTAHLADQTPCRSNSLWTWTKQTSLKVSQVTGFSFLPPIILLLDGDNPAKQLREIIRTILVPTLAFAAFLLLWTLVAPHHRTKSGVVPTPAAVWNAARSVWAFHEREGQKELAYRLTGVPRGATAGRSPASRTAGTLRACRQYGTHVDTATA